MRLMSRPWIIGVVVVALASAVGSMASAQSPEPASGAVAQSLFEAGRALMDEQKYEEACAKFEASQRIDPSAGTLLNLGRCLEMRGKTASAWAIYKQTIALGNATNKPRQVSAAEQYLADLTPKLCKLEIVVASTVPGLTIKAGSLELDEAARGEPVPMDPGTYAIVAEAPGHQPWRGEVTLTEGASERVLVPVLTRALEPPPPPPAPTRERELGPLFISGVTVGGAGVITLAIGAAFGAITLSDASELEDDPALCPDRRCSAAGLAALEQAEANAEIATGTIIAGGIAIAGGGALAAIGLLTGEPPPKVGVVPLVGETKGFAVVGQW
jgi:tetratricopeptide (TPR) repeat protein